MAWNKQLALAFVIFLSMPALPAAGPLGAASGGASSGDTQFNISIATPAFLQLNLYMFDDAAHREALDLGDVMVDISDSAGERYVHANPIPVVNAATIRVRIYGHSGGYSGSDILYDINYTSGAAGSYRVMTVNFDVNELASSGVFLPVRVLFRPYDSTTGVGFPVEQFNITVQFQDQDLGNCQPGCYTVGPEIPLGLGYLDTYYGLNMTIRVRDYFGNILYNVTRILRFDNATICNPVIEPAYAGQCSTFTNAFQTWDIPLTVYSFKTFNQKPDQFIKAKLFWNGSGAGEEVYAPNSGLFPDWWDAAYTYRNRLVVNTSTGLNTSFDYNMSFDVTPYMANGRVQGDLRDLRVAYYNFTSMAWTEVNRSYNATTQRLYFKAAAWLAPGTTNRGYFIYYGNALAGAPPTFTPYRTLVLSTSGTIGYWPLDETSGAAFADVSLHGNACSITGGPTLGVQGEVAKGVDWGGVDTRKATCPAITTSQFTVEGWYRPTSTPSNTRSLAEDHFGSSDFNFVLWALNNGKLHFEVRGSTGTASFDTVTTLTVGVWTHIAASFDGTTAKVYFNALADANTGTASGTFPRITQNFKLGNEGFADRSLTGTQDEWSFSSRALTQAELTARYEEGVGQNGTGTAALETANAFQWFESPTETVERFLNPGYYQLQIVTDNRTGVQTKANLGVNITEANYYMVSGTNITRFIGDFQSIYSQTQIIANAFRPDVIAYGELLPTSPSQLHAMSLDEQPTLHDPFSILSGSTAYTGAAGTNVTSYKPAMSSESSNDGSILATVTILHDKFVFTGAEPSITHVWINYTNGTNIWENASLPPSVDLAGIQGDVYIVTNRTVSTARISDFRAVWTFSVAYYATSRRYEVSLSLNNSMNRTVYNPYWFVSFPENATINITSAAVEDLDNVVWLQRGQNFATGPDGYYLSFDGLNASTVRRFFFQYYDANATGAQSVPVISVNDIAHATFRGSTAYWQGNATWSNPFTSAYAGEIIVKLSCAECVKADTKTIAVIDGISGRQLSPEEYYTTGIDIHITAAAVGSVAVGAQRTYIVYTKLTLSAETTRIELFTVLFYLGPIAFTPFVFGLAVLGVMLVATARAEDKRVWMIMTLVFGMLLFTVYLMRSLTLIH